MGCPHIQQTARALRSRSHAIFRMYGQRDARPTPRSPPVLRMLYCGSCPGSSMPHPGLYPPCPVPRYCLPGWHSSGCTPSLFCERHPRGVFAGAVSPRGAMACIALSACAKRAPPRWRRRRPNRKESYGLSYCVSLYYTGLDSAIDCKISSRCLSARPCR